MRYPNLLVASLFLVLGITGAGCYANGFGQSSAHSAYGPPAPTTVYHQSRTDSVFVEGRWNWVNNAWQWQPGFWQPNRVGHVYVQGYWNQQPSGWAYVDGRWNTQRVGYTYSRGYWNTRGSSRLWVRGRWLQNRPGQQYSQGHWVTSNGRNTYRRGSWSARSSTRRSRTIDHRTRRSTPRRRSGRPIHRRRR